TFLVLYGSLSSGQPKFDELGLDRLLESRGPCEFSGILYDLDDYPGARPGVGVVKGEAYKVLDEAVLVTLDEYEEFDENDPAGSLFVRRCVHIHGVGDAWVYLYNRECDETKRILSGDWVEHLAGRPLMMV